MLLNVQTRRTWTPDILDNEKQPEGQRIEVEYRRPPAYARNNWERRIARRTGEGRIEAFVDTDVREIVRSSDVRIRNLAVSVDGGPPAEIVTGEQLVETRSDYCWLLATRLADEIIRPEISGEVVKNSAPDSGASS